MASLDTKERLTPAQQFENGRGYLLRMVAAHAGRTSVGEVIEPSEFLQRSAVPPSPISYEAED